jgi:flagellar protein FliS
MISPRTPAAAYRQVEFDARVVGARPEELVLLCYEQAFLALGTALHAARADDNARKSEALTRALSALTALQLGIDEASPIAPAVNQWLAASRNRILDCVLAFDPPMIEALRTDIAELSKAFTRALRAH